MKVGIVNDVLFYANRVDSCAKRLKRRQCLVMRGEEGVWRELGVVGRFMGRRLGMGG